MGLLKKYCGVWISIHALREEGDPYHKTLIVYAILFLSTPSARRATAELGTCSSEIAMISIHALREEGDTGSRTALYFSE